MGYLFMLLTIMMLGSLLLLVLVDAVSKEKKRMKESVDKTKIVTRPATWKDGARAIGIDVSRYEKYAGALTERYPLAMESLIKMEWLAAEMNNEEKNKVRYEFEKKFDEVVREADRKQRERISGEIEDVLKDSFKENEYVK